MTIKGRGNQWQRKGFSVFMNTDGEKEPDKCLRCRSYKGKKCKVCDFQDRGFIINIRRAGK